MICSLSAERFRFTVPFFSSSSPAMTMYFAPAHEFAPDVPKVDPLTGFAIALGVAAVVVLGLFPQPLLNLFADIAVLGLR